MGKPVPPERALRTFLAQQILDPATANLAADYADRLGGLVEWINDAELGYVLPPSTRHPGDDRGGGGHVSGTYEPDRSVAGKVIPDLEDDVVQPVADIPNGNRDATSLLGLWHGEQVRLKTLALWYEGHDLGRLAPFRLQHHLCRHLLTLHIGDSTSADAITDALAVHRVLAVGAKVDPEWKRRRKAGYKRWYELLLGLERALGKRPPRPGRYDSQGRVQIESVDESGRRRVG